MFELTEDERRRFDAVFRQHHDRVLRTCLSFAAGDRDWAVDRVQEAFIQLAKNIRKLEDQDDLGGWLYRVSVNTCLMALRRRRGYRRLLASAKEVFSAKTVATERQVLARKDLNAVAQAIASLPANQCALMTLIHIEQVSQTEAAELLGISKGYASKLQHRAIERLKSMDWELGDS